MTAQGCRQQNLDQGNATGQKILFLQQINFKKKKEWKNLQVKRDVKDIAPISVYGLRLTGENHGNFIGY